jgi:hypothetical protein
LGDGTVPPEVMPAELPANVRVPSPCEVCPTKHGPAYLGIETVLARIVETNTYPNLDPPIEIYNEPDGFHSNLVFDNSEP